MTGDSSDRLRTPDRIYKTFPPGWRHLRIPMASRGAALAGLALYAACRPRAVWAQRAACAAVRWLGPRALPGPAVPWAPPMAAGEWAALAARWTATLGPFDTVAICERLQAARSGFSLLLIQGEAPVAFVKLRPAGSNLDHEWRAMEAVWRSGPTAFVVPAPMGFASVGPWAYLATAALPPRPHRAPVHPPLDDILRDIEAGLASVPRPVGTPPHWRAMHGDFTPWNLRQLDTGGLVLLDWEAAGWGPPGADDVLYRATASVLSGRTVPPSDAREALGYWQEAIARRQGGPRDVRLESALRDALARMLGGASALVRQV